MAFWKEPAQKEQNNLRSLWDGGVFKVFDSVTNDVLLSIDSNNIVIGSSDFRIGDINVSGRVIIPTGELFASAGEMNNSAIYSRHQKVFSGQLGTAAGADDIVFAWTNTEGVDVIVTRVLVDITTAGGTATATLDVGAAADATTGNAGLITGANANTTAAYDNMDIAGEGVATFVRVPDGECITAQIKTEAAAALEGDIWIFYSVA